MDDLQRLASAGAVADRTAVPDAAAATRALAALMLTLLEPEDKTITDRRQAVLVGVTTRKAGRR